MCNTLFSLILWACIQTNVPVTVTDYQVSNANPPLIIIYSIYKVISYFPVDEQVTASRVFWCESRWNRNHIGAYGELSVAQIHPVHWARLGLTDDWYLDDEIVGWAARNIWDIQGWSAWSGCYEGTLLR